MHERKNTETKMTDIQTNNNIINKNAKETKGLWIQYQYIENESMEQNYDIFSLHKFQEQTSYETIMQY